MLHQHLRHECISYFECARQERELLTRLAELDLRYHRQVKEARCLQGWVSFLRDSDIGHIERSDWDERSEMEEALPLHYAGLTRYAEFTRVLRNYPPVLAVLSELLDRNHHSSKKLRAMLGDDVHAKQAAACVESIGLSLFANVFQARDFARLAATLRAMLDRALASSTSSSSSSGRRSARKGNPLDILDPPLSELLPVRASSSSFSSSNGGDSQKRGKRRRGPEPPETAKQQHQNQHHPHHKLHFAVRVLSLSLRRFTLPLLARTLREPLASILSDEAVVYDPHPVLALADFKRLEQVHGVGNLSLLLTSHSAQSAALERFVAESFGDDVPNEGDDVPDFGGAVPQRFGAAAAPVSPAPRKKKEKKKKKLGFFQRFRNIRSSNKDDSPSPPSSPSSPPSPSSPHHRSTRSLVDQDATLSPSNSQHKRSLTALDDEEEDHAPRGVLTLKEVRRASNPMAISTSETRKLILHRTNNLRGACDRFLHALTQKMPAAAWTWQSVALLQQTLAAAEHLCPASDEQARLEHGRAVLARVVFSLLVLPAIEECDLSGLFSDMPVTTRGRRDLQAIARVLHALFHGRPFEQHNYLHAMNAYVETRRSVADAYVDALLDRCGWRLDQERYEPGDVQAPDADHGSLNMGSVCISLRELTTMHDVLFRNRSKWESNEQLAEWLLPFASLPTASDLPPEVLAGHYLIDLVPTLNLAPGEVNDGLPVIRDIMDAVERVHERHVCHPDSPLITSTAAALPTLADVATARLPELARVAAAHEFASEEAAAALPPKPTKLESVSKYMRHILCMLTRVFLFVDEDMLLGCPDDDDLLGLLAHLRRVLTARLDTDWEANSTLLAVLQELDNLLHPVPARDRKQEAARGARRASFVNSSSSTFSGSVVVTPMSPTPPDDGRARGMTATTTVSTPLPDEFLAQQHAILKPFVMTGAEHLFASHRRTWAVRRRRLHQAIERARRSLDEVQFECKFLERILFHRKVLSFMSTVEIPCRLQMPPTIVHRSVLADESAPAGNGSTHQHSGKGPLFYCGSVDTFVSEFLEYCPSLEQHPLIAAKIFHCFLNVTEQRCAEDATFSPNEVGRATEIIERYISCRLFTRFFPRSELGAATVEEDAMCRAATVELNKWLRPGHLELDIPVHSAFWAHAVDSIKALDRHDVYRSPRAKIRLVTQAIKWIAKIVQAKGGEGVDADTSLSALIYALVKAKPRALASNMFFIQTFRPESKLIGEDGYCLTQFSGAMRYVTETLARMEPIRYPYVSISQVEAQRRKQQQRAQQEAQAQRQREEEEQRKQLAQLEAQAQSVRIVGASAQPTLGLLLQMVLSSRSVRDRVVEYLGVRPVLENVCLVSRLWSSQFSDTSLLRKRRNLLRLASAPSAQSPTRSRRSSSKLTSLLHPSGANRDGERRLAERRESHRVWNTAVMQNLDGDQTLLDYIGSARFLRFAAELRVEENVLFYREVQHFRANLAPFSAQQHTMMLRIYHRYLRAGSRWEVHALPREARRTLVALIANIVGLSARLLAMVSSQAHDVDPQATNGKNGRQENTPDACAANAMRLLMDDEHLFVDPLLDSSDDDDDSDGEQQPQAVRVKDLMAVRVHTPMFGGGHLTVRCERRATVGQAKTKVMKTLRKKGFIAPAKPEDTHDRVADLYYLRRTHDDVSVPGQGPDAAPRYEPSTSKSPGVHEELTLCEHAVTPQVGAGSDPVVLPGLFDEAQQRVAAIIRLSILPKWQEAGGGGAQSSAPETGS